MERGSGKPVPALSRKPELHDDLLEIWEAFWVLHRTRDIGFGPGFIKLTEIAAYLELFPQTRPEFFIRSIQALDRIYLEDYNVKKPKSGKSGTAATHRTKNGRRSRTPTSS